MFLHNTALGKWASNLFETNALRPLNFDLKTDVIPVVQIDPFLDIVRTANGSGTVNIYTTPTDKDFYLTNINMNTTGDEFTQGNIIITFTAYDGQQRQYSFGTTAQSSTCVQDIVFPKRGLLLAKNTNIIVQIAPLGGVLIAGYLGSDRA